MKITVICENSSVAVNSEFLQPVNLEKLDSNIHAIQWNENYGHIEYKTQYIDGVIFKPQNKIIEDFSEFMFVIDEWNITKEKLIQLEAIEKQKAEERISQQSQQASV